MVGDIIQFIKYERLKRGFSLRELSERSGVRPATICEIETGKNKGGIETISSILKGLGYELDVKKSDKKSE